MAYTTSTAGLDLIKKYEGCRLTAYKAVKTEKYYTIGYGHYGADVKAGMTITQAQAEKYLKADLSASEKAVNSYSLDWMNQNRFDALVSFTYNCGVGNLKTLLNSGKRPAAEVSSKLTAYNKSGGKVLSGLTKRRIAEKKLFDAAAYEYNGVDYSRVFDPTFYSNLYSDLKSAFGANASKLFEHFCSYGMAEGRKACAGFDVMVYKANNPDIVQALGSQANSLKEYYKHYCVYGYKENRKAV